MFVVGELIQLIDLSSFTRLNAVTLLDSIGDLGRSTAGGKISHPLGFDERPRRRASSSIGG